MNEFDYSMIGARWMMPFSNVIIHNAQGYLFIDSNGRKHQLPASIVYERYQVPLKVLVSHPMNREIYYSILVQTGTSIFIVLMLENITIWFNNSMNRPMKKSY
jgi:hypothetical protein